jgi:hypothetical protein
MGLRSSQHDYAGLLDADRRRGRAKCIHPDMVLVEEEAGICQKPIYSRSPQLAAVAADWP